MVYLYPPSIFHHPLLPHHYHQPSHHTVPSILQPPGSKPFSQLEPQQIPHHLPARNPRRPPQRREIQGAGKRICISKPQHGRDPSPRVLQRETGRLHLILLDGTALEMVHAALRVDLRFVGSGRVGELRAGEDVEIVVGRVAATVPFGTDGRAEDYEVFGDAWNFGN